MNTLATLELIPDIRLGRLPARLVGFESFAPLGLGRGCKNQRLYASKQQNEFEAAGKMAGHRQLSVPWVVACGCSVAKSQQQLLP